MNMDGTAWTLWLGGSYLLGSISFAALITRWRAGTDLRTVGSGNLGATNAARVLGWRWGLLIYALDALKGIVPVAAAQGAGDPALGASVTLPLSLVAGLAAILGHCFPIWARFKGGKGVATTSGVLAMLCPMVFGAALLVFAAAVLITRRISVGSILAATSLPIAWMFQEQRNALNGRGIAMLTLLFGVMVLLLVMHRGNMLRIVRGEEPKIGGSRKS